MAAPAPHAPADGGAAAAAPAVPSWGSARSVDVFEKLEQIGEGTYGQVYMAKSRETGEIVALKKVRMDNEKEGFPITAIREIKILKSLTHNNVVKMKEIVVSRAHAANQNKGSIYMVFEYMDHDLTGLAERPGVKFTMANIKFFMKQLLQGLHYCHKNNILHRDIKGSNILIDNAGVVKIADFGLARSYAGQESTNPLTNRVITLWYRPPELLLGSTKYGPEVDMWSVGCIFAELVMGKPILPGKNEMEQVDLIFRLCGTPTEEVWSGCTKLPWFHMFKPEKPHRRRLLEHLARAPADVQDLCDKLLTLDPAKRLRADSAILHDFFYNEPQPAAPQQHYESSHEFQTKKRRQELRAKAEAEAAAKRAHTDAGAMSGAGGRAQMPYQHGSHAAGIHAPSGGMHPYAMHGAGAAGAAPSGYGGVYGGAPASAGMGFSAQPRAGAPPAGPPAAGARPHDYRAAVTGQPPRGPDGRPLPPAGAAGPPRGPDGRPLPPGASRPPPR